MLGNSMMKRCIGMGALGLALLSAVAVAVDSTSESGVYTGQDLVVHAQARTPDQTTAFYLGRGFPAAMLKEFNQSCFVTVSMRHTRPDVVWLEPARWRLRDANGRIIERRDRHYWNRVWKTINAPHASRATFGWTQLPESRDLQPDEPVGGNITIVPPTGPFSLEFRLATGKNKTGPEIVGRIEGLICQAQESDTVTGNGP